MSHSTQHQNRSWVTCTVALLILLSSSTTVIGQVKLNLQMALQIALTNNAAIKIQEIERDIATLDAQAARAVYDTLSKIDLQQIFERKDVAIPIFGTKNDITNFDLATEKTFASGTRASVQWTNDRFQTDSTFSTINPTYESNLILGLSQPLLQNFLGRNPRLAIDIADTNVEAMRLRIEDEIERLIGTVIIAFWQARFHQENIRYLKDSVYWAQRLVESNRKKLKLRIIEESDMASAKANLTSRKTAQLEEEAALRAAEINLLTLLKLPASTKLIVTEEWNNYTPIENIKPVVATAMKQRRDLKITQFDRRRYEMSSKLENNRLLPSLDLNANVTFNGLSGNVGDALGDVFGAENVGFGVGAMMTYNWDNVQTRASAKQAEMRRRQTSIQLAQTQTAIRNEVARSIQNLNTYVLLVSQTQELVDLQTKILKLETKKLKQGRSSTVDLVRHQNDLLSAQGRLVNQRRRLELTYNAHLRIQNTLLQSISTRPRPKQ